MKVPVQINKLNIDGSSEFLGPFLDVEMVIDANIDFPIDTIKIVPGKGKRMTNFEISTMLAALKLTSWDNAKTFQHLKGKEALLAKYMREALIEAMDEMTQQWRHVFYALIDRPKNYKKKKVEKVAVQPEVSQEDQQLAMMNEMFQAELALNPVDETDIEIEEETQEVIQPVQQPKRKAVKEAKKGEPIYEHDETAEDHNPETIELPGPGKWQSFTVTKVKKATLRRRRGKTWIGTNMEGRVKVKWNEKVDNIIRGSWSRRLSNKRLGE